MLPLLLVLAFVLPFEVARPLFHLGPLGITSVELPLYALVALTLGRRQAWRFSTWTLVHWAAIAWAAAHLVSATTAQGDRWSAWRFALRMTVGAALCFPAAMEARKPGGAARVLQALVAGAVLSATMGVAEAFFPGAASLLAPFKTTTALVGGVVRAGGPFQYPNPAALYWGAALPVLLVTSPWPGRGKRPIVWTLATAGVSLVVALVASGSRGGLLTTAGVLGLLAALAPLDLRGAAMKALALLAAVACLIAVLRPALILRDSSTWGEAPWFAGDFEPLGPPPALAAGRGTAVRVQVKNAGTLPWKTSGPMPMAVSAQWLDALGHVAHEEAGTPLAVTVAPGATAVVDVGLTAPERPGRYTVRFQLVGGGTSFEASAVESGHILIDVTGAAVAPARAWPAPRPVQRQTTRPELWRAGLRMWRERPVLGVGPDGFRELYGGYLGTRMLDSRINANSLYVETLADLGLAGAMALLLVLVSLGREATRALRQVSGPARGLILGSAAALLAFALHGLVDSVLAFTPLHGLFWIHAGLLAGASEARRTPTA